jgi:hypothetical protein
MRCGAWDWLALAMKLWKDLTDSSTKSSKASVKMAWYAVLSVRSG